MSDRDKLKKKRWGARDGEMERIEIKLDLI